MRKTTKTKALAALLVLAMALSLTACGHEHVWYVATCTAPQTCSECGETKGEALGHSWEDATCATPKTCSVCKETEGEALPHTWEEATCTTPKTCSVCGETEGEALGHDWQEANYQSPQTCTVCGETEGDVLTPEFEKYSVELAPHEGEYDIMFTAMDDSGAHRMGKISLADYQIFESDETNPAKEGYEYRTAVVDLLVYENISEPNRPYAFSYCGCEYYDVTVSRDNGEGAGVPINATGTVSISGVEYEFWIEIAQELHPWEKSEEQDMWVLPITFRVIAQVPVGYDGAVACIYDTAIISDDIKNADGEFSPVELFSNNPGHYAAFRLD